MKGIPYIAENINKIIVIQPKHGYAKKYKRALDIRDHQKRKRLKKKWNNIITRYINKYTTVKYIAGYEPTVVNIVDRTAYTMPEGDYYSPIVITCNKGPED